MFPVSSGLYETIFESAPDAIIVVDVDGRIVQANRQTEALFLYGRREVVGEPIEKLIPERFHSMHVHHRTSYMAASRVRRMGAGLDLYARRKDGSEFPVDVMLSPLGEASSRLVMAVVRDITERRKQEEQVRQSTVMFELLTENAPDAIVVVGGNGRIVRVNAQAEALFQYQRKDMVGLLVEALLPERFQEVHRIHRREYFNAARARPMGAGLTLFARRKDGSEVPVDIMLSPVEQDGQAMVLAVIRDITERKLAEEREKMRLELQQKEVLIKEVHHRVKNNLQVISSLLGLQELSVTNPAHAAMFQNSQARVNAMALMHEKLYRSSASAGTDLRFDEYLQDLLRSLSLTFNLDQRKVRLELDAQPIQMSIDVAVPCGLIVNELVTNSIKHAFPEGRGGLVTVTLQREDSAVALKVRDNGVGMPPGNPHASDAGLGLQLIQSLAAQVQGTYSISGVGGTETIIRIPTPEAP